MHIWIDISVTPIIHIWYSCTNDLFSVSSGLQLLKSSFKLPSDGSYVICNRLVGAHVHVYTKLVFLSSNYAHLSTRRLRNHHCKKSEMKQNLRYAWKQNNYQHREMLELSISSRKHNETKTQLTKRNFVLCLFPMHGRSFFQWSSKFAIIHLSELIELFISFIAIFQFRFHCGIRCSWT